MVGKHCVICDGILSMVEEELVLLVTQIKHSALRKDTGFMHASQTIYQTVLLKV